MTSQPDRQHGDELRDGSKRSVSDSDAPADASHLPFRTWQPADSTSDTTRAFEQDRRELVQRPGPTDEPERVPYWGFPRTRSSYILLIVALLLGIGAGLWPALR